MKLIMGTASSGKTRELIKSAVNELKEGKKVIYYSEEETAEEVYTIIESYSSLPEDAELSVINMDITEALLDSIIQGKTDEDTIYLVDGKQWVVNQIKKYPQELIASANLVLTIQTPYSKAEKKLKVYDGMASALLLQNN